MEYNLDLLTDTFRKINIELSDKQISQFIKYYEMLVEKNKVMNLTAITEYEDVIIKHFADSLLSYKVIDLSNVDSLIDVGTGAGFPGIPLKIVFPQMMITLLDSLKKRINFLNEVIDELGLENVEFIHGRAEDFGHDAEYREQYDLCVSRAVANLSTLSEYCLPFIKVGGKFVSYKAANIDEELNNAKNAIKKLGGNISDTKTMKLPNSDEIERNFVIIDKISKLSNKYPRKSGIPSREPLS